MTAIDPLSSPDLEAALIQLAAVLEAGIGVGDAPTWDEPSVTFCAAPEMAQYALTLQGWITALWDDTDADEPAFPMIGSTGSYADTYTRLLEYRQLAQAHATGDTALAAAARAWV